MANIDLYKQKLVNIADAIRSKNGELSNYTLEQMPGKIIDIPTGGGVEIVNGYNNKDGSFAKDFSMATVATFNSITIANGYEPLSLTRS